MFEFQVRDIYINWVVPEQNINIIDRIEKKNSHNMHLVSMMLKATSCTLNKHSLSLVLVANRDDYDLY
jgi:hypothetical protein